MSNENAREIHAKVLDILKFLDKICKEHNWSYYLAYGTLLGAVRHSGFIPWDDDIDIWMPRKDYDELLRYLRNDNSDTRYVLAENHYALKHTRPSEWLLRIFDLQTKINCEASQSIKYLWLDIMPLENVELSKKKRFLRQVNRKQFFYKLARCKLYKFNVGGISGMFNKVMYTLHHKLKLFKYSLDEQKRLDKLIKTASKYVEKETDGYFCHGFVYNVSAPHKCFFEKKWFDNLTEMTFEDMTSLIPGDYDSILKLLYGDYMVLPPEEKRIFHGIEILED